MDSGMPVYPGTAAPEFLQAHRLDSDGFREKRLSMVSHTGTHVDAPAHILEGGATLDALPAETFLGRGVLVDVTGDTGPTIRSDVVETGLAADDDADFLLIRTGWDRLWGSEAYFRGYPVLAPEAAAAAASAGLKGVALDCISADPADTEGFPVHRILLGAGLVIVENLRGLEELPARGFRFSCFPLRIVDADGSPVRAVAWIDENDGSLVSGA